jgi:hypothetical protein
LPDTLADALLEKSQRTLKLERFDPVSLLPELSIQVGTWVSYPYGFIPYFCRWSGIFTRIG